jgi:hypothetical protein
MPWLSFDEQVEKLTRAGLQVDDKAELRRFLSRVNCFRFLGYFRHFQTFPSGGDPFFVGVSFNQIRCVYEADIKLSAAILDALQEIELLLRTRFAQYFGADATRARGVFMKEGIFTPSPEGKSQVHECIARDVTRSKERFLNRYFDEASSNEGVPIAEAWRSLPIWAAVEVFSFGTLSRSIEASQKMGVTKQIAESIGVPQSYLPQIIKSFVYLRNRCAHHSRLWNHSVIDAPSLPPQIKRRAKKRRQYVNRSVYQVLVAIDYFLDRSKLQKKWQKKWLEAVVEPILLDERYSDGICDPQLYLGQ